MNHSVDDSTTDHLNVHTVHIENRTGAGTWEHSVRSRREKSVLESLVGSLLDGVECTFS